MNVPCFLHSASGEKNDNRREYRLCSQEGQTGYKKLSTKAMVITTRREIIQIKHAISKVVTAFLL